MSKISKHIKMCGMFLRPGGKKYIKSINTGTHIPYSRINMVVTWATTCTKRYIWTPNFKPVNASMLSCNSLLLWFVGSLLSWWGVWKKPGLLLVLSVYIFYFKHTSDSYYSKAFLFFNLSILFSLLAYIIPILAPEA